MIECVLCMDIGTTSLKAGLISATGEVVSFSNVFFDDNKNRFAASSWFSCACAAVSKLKAECTIVGIAVSGNGPTIVTDSGLTFFWNEELPDVKFGNLSEAAQKSLFIPRILQLKKSFPKEYKKSQFIFSGPEYLIYILTGNAVTILPEKRFEMAYWTKQICKETKILFSKLPPFVPVSADCGVLSDSAASLKNAADEKIKFSDECRVFAGGPDFVAALIGTNTLFAGKLCDRCGSSEGLNFCVDKPIFAEGIRTLPSVIPELWNISVLIPNSGTMKKSDRLNAVVGAVNKLRNLAHEHQMEFPTEMSVSGGQAEDKQFLKEKSEKLGIKINVDENGSFYHSELLGDAKAAFVGLGKYTSLQEVWNENL